MAINVTTTSAGQKRMSIALDMQNTPQPSSSLSFPAMRTSSNAMEVNHRSIMECAASLNRVIRINNQALNLDKIEPAGELQVELKWTDDAENATTDFDSTDIPINPPPYDTPLKDSLPFNQQSNILLAKMKSTFHCCKFLWMCLTSKQLFWLIGYVPRTLSTWRESMLRHSNYALTRKKGIHCVDDDGTVLFSIAKRFVSISLTMEDGIEPKSRVAGATKYRKCILKVAKRAKTLHTCKLLELTAFGNSGVVDHIWAQHYPETLACQDAGTYCTGVLVSNGGKVLVKNSNYDLNVQAAEVRALQALSGTIGVPKFIGRGGEQLVLADSGTVPHHGILTSEHLGNLCIIIDAIHANGWTIEHVTRQNIWTHGNSVMLFNFENAVPISGSKRLMAILDFVQACADNCPVNFSSQVITVANCDSTDANGHPNLNDDFNVEFEENNASVVADSDARVSDRMPLASMAKPAVTTFAETCGSRIITRSTYAAGAVLPIKSCDIFSKQQTLSLAPSSQPAVASFAETSKSCNIVVNPRRVLGFIGPTSLASALRNWISITDKEKLDRVSELWKITHDKVYPGYGPNYSWEVGLKGHRPGSLGYGEATSPLGQLLCKIYTENRALNQLSLSNQTFVDIGSGIGNVVLKMAALQPTFKLSFGIELCLKRAVFAQQACDVFTSNAAKGQIPFCAIQAQYGNCFDDNFCKNALLCAGLVWTNNEIFKPEDNVKLYRLLHSLVPVGCIIVSFVELLVTKRLQNTTSIEPSDFTVLPPQEIKGSNSWDHPDKAKKVFIIQRSSYFYANGSRTGR